MAFLEQHPVAHPHFRAVLLIHQAVVEGRRWEDVGEHDRSLVQSTLISARFAANVPVLQGDAGQAVTLLRVAARLGDRNLALLDNDPCMDVIRESAEFQTWRNELAQLREKEAAASAPA